MAFPSFKPLPSLNTVGNLNFLKGIAFPTDFCFSIYFSTDQNSSIPLHCTVTTPSSILILTLQVPLPEPFEIALYILEC